MKVRDLWAVGLVGGTAMAVAAVLTVVRSDGGDPGATGEGADVTVRGVLLGGVEDPAGAGVADAEIVVTAAGTGERLASATADSLGLFEIEIGDLEGPVVVQATKADLSGATVVAVSADAAATGVRVVAGGSGPGSVTGVVTADDAPVAEPGVVEAKFVESGRTLVAPVAADGTYQLDGLPLDGDVILVATLASGERQGLAASVVAETIAANTADIALGANTAAGAANQVSGPGIITTDLSGWSVDGPVTVSPPG